MKSFCGLDRLAFSSVLLVMVLTRRTRASTDPCSTTQNIGDPKRSTQNDPGVCNGLLCDNYIQEGPDQWFRLDGESTGIRMPESCVQVWRCGTYMPVWMNGAHPTIDSPGPKRVQVCAQQIHNDNCCAWSDYINVKICKDTASREYFVYQLKALPYCDMAYCAGIGRFCEGNAAWNEVTGNCTSPKYPLLPTEPPTLSPPYISSTKQVTVDGKSYTATKFSVNCTLHHTKQTKDDGTRYDVVFEASGEFVASYTIKSTDDTTVVLDEHKLVGFLDRRLRCKVTSYWMSEYPVRKQPYIASEERFLGIEVIEVLTGGERIVDSINQPLSLTEGLRNTIKFRATFPITSPACYDSPSSGTCNPEYQFRISAQGIKLSTCIFKISPENAVSAKLVVSPKYTIETSGLYDGSMKIEAENSVQSEGSIFNGYRSSDMKVKIIDTKDSVYCSSTGDPHYKTFRGSYFHVYLVGDLSLMRMSARNLDIQTRTVSCASGVSSQPVSCNCGVMAREGNNILGVNFCDGSSPNYVRLQYDYANPGGYISTSSGSFTIYLLSGIEIKGDFWGSNYMDLHVRGLGTESYDGMCSYYGDEIQCLDQCNRNPPDGYRVPEKDSLFRLDSISPPECKTSPIIPACDCSDNFPCFAPDLSYPIWTGYSCNKPNNRVKRDISSNHITNYTTTEIEKLFNNLAFDSKFGTQLINLTWPTAGNHIQEADAKNKCEQSLKISTAYSFCINKVNVSVTRILGNCMSDIQLTDNITFAQDSIARSLEAECGITIEKMQAANASNPATSQLQKELLAVLCSPQCSQRGTCSNRTCICESGYMGEDCSVKQGDAPKVTEIQNSPCNIQNSDCLKASISQTGAVTNGLICKIKDANGFVYYDKEPTVVYGWAYCHLRPTPVSYSNQFADSTTNYTVYISISNDNRTYSVELAFVVYDGLCIECLNSFACTQKTTACNILGRCYELQSELPCKIGDVRTCNPSICVDKWTYSTSHSCKDGIDKCPLNSGRAVASEYLFLMSCLLLFKLTSFTDIRN